MPSFRVTLAYDGAGFVGWQRQATGTSIQGVVEDALGDLDQRDVGVTAAGRTDAGVHALGQVASFSLERSIAPDALVRALNARLPDTIRVVDAAEAPSTFHARFDARSKSYRYRIWNDDVLVPFERAYAWHVPGRLAIDEMIAAARLLEGRHDFAAFQGTGSTTQTTERIVFSSRICGGGPQSEVEYRPDFISEGPRRTSGLIVYEITGDGFLRHMVRNIVGSLVEIGRGRRDVEWIRRVLASRDRTYAGPTAPAEGLFLMRVDYNNPDVA